MAPAGPALPRPKPRPGPATNPAERQPTRRPGLSCPLVVISDPLTLDALEAVARGAPPPQLDAVARERIAAARAVVEGAVARGETVYGVSTGIGELANVRIDRADAEHLQLNLLR